MVLFIYCLGVLLFCTAFYFVKPVNIVHEIITLSKYSLVTLTDKLTSDVEKEKAIQVAAVDMLKCSLLLLLKLMVIIGVTILPVFVADEFDLIYISEITQFSLRLDVILYTTLGVALIVFFIKNLKYRD